MSPGSCIESIDPAYLLYRGRRIKHQKTGYKARTHLCTVNHNIDSKILKFLQKQDWPVTTENIAKAIGMSWNTTQIHLYKLVAEGKVVGKRVGRQNQWMLKK